GNPFQRELVGPASERLLALRPGERILDVACGNGVFTRRLAQLGARVTGIDGSPRFIDLARTRTPPHDDRIDYRVVDATDEAQLLALGDSAFDALVCNMALMDMPAIDPLLRAATRLLAPNGRFVFSVQHPAFNSNAVSLCGERDAGDSSSYWVKITDYLDVPAGKGVGMPGEPLPTGISTARCTSCSAPSSGPASCSTGWRSRASRHQATIRTGSIGATCPASRRCWWHGRSRDE
ncbi:MAG: class I SAM-dependent methyltransferase, partial [Thermomicrobiales bacterium]|nr:class I SAM-dependent methyltransferase [Thermomicrobiales bacterium]